jgi:ribonuclease D
MIWLEQDIQRLLRLTFNPSKSVIELERSMSRAQEAELLQRFNSIVDTISDQEEINPTLFFSKKLQKDFLRLVLNKGLDVACDEITAWRSNLIRDRLLDLLK